MLKRCSVLPKYANHIFKKHSYHLCNYEALISKQNLKVFQCCRSHQQRFSTSCFVEKTRNGLIGTVLLQCALLNLENSTVTFLDLQDKH